MKGFFDSHDSFLGYARDKIPGPLSTISAQRERKTESWTQAQHREEYLQSKNGMKIISDFSLPNPGIADLAFRYE
jgi:hypothetical protein